MTDEKINELLQIYRESIYEIAKEFGGKIKVKLTTEEGELTFLDHTVERTPEGFFITFEAKSIRDEVVH